MILWRQVLNALLIISPAVLLLAASAAWDLLKSRKGTE